MPKPRFQFNAAAYLILKREGKVLLARRFNTGWMDGMYTLPAGHIDGRETAQAAMAREAAEELGIQVSPRDLRVVHVMHRRAADELEYFDFFLEAEKYDGEPRNNEEHKCDHLAWFPVDDLPENTLDYLKEVLRLVSEGEHFSSFGFE